MNKNLILVDEKDNVIGQAPKSICHLGRGRRHRAFSIFIFNKQGELLIQKRSAKKMLWPGYWANSCCSHPRTGEDMASAVNRRLWEELGLKSRLNYILKFRYQAKFKTIGSENEFCHIFAGKLNGKIKANPQEIAAWRFSSLKFLYQDIKTNPRQYAPWFKTELKKLEKIKFNPKII